MNSPTPPATAASDLPALVDAAREGDSQAWSTLVDRFAGLIYAACRGFRLTQADAADISQTVWLKLAENLHRIEQPERLGAWLVTTTKRECLALWRTSSRYEPLAGDPDGWVAGQPGPESTVARMETITEVASAYSLLSERCRELLRRVVADREESYQEISQALSMPIGSIGPTRSRCLGQLKRHLVEAGYAS